MWGVRLNRVKELRKVIQRRNTKKTASFFGSRTPEEVAVLGEGVLEEGEVLGVRQGGQQRQDVRVYLLQHSDPFGLHLKVG